MFIKDNVIKRWKVFPGNKIQESIYSLRVLKLAHGHTAEELFHLLAGLPFREQVANGRDFRGLDFSARELDLQFCDFTYAKISAFYSCHLDHSVFDECIGERATFHQSLDSCSFVGANLRSCYFNYSIARNCNFTNAKLVSCNFQNADLRGSRFSNADCRECTFFGANLIGCDFRGANLEDAVFCAVSIDKSTDFRGSDLTKTLARDWFDNHGNVIGRGADFSLGTT